MNQNQTLEQIPIKDIVLSGDNQRQIDAKSEDIRELAASIKGGGVENPVQVSPHPKHKGKYVLIAGERRYVASRIAGAETVPAIVISEVSDADRAGRMAVENMFRQDLKPMEQAAQIALWMERAGGDVKAIAQKLGKDEKWVRLRANIHGHMATCWREIFGRLDEYPMFASWSVTHLALISRLPEHIQVDLHNQLKGHWTPYFEKAWGCSVKDLETLIGGGLHLLSKTTWALGDATLIPKAGPCTDCPKRSGHQPMLWFDSDAQAASGDQCLDGFCWRNKADAWLKRRARELKDQYGSLALITKEHADYDEGEALSEAFGPYMDKYAYKIVSKSTEGAVAAMYINSAAAGQLTYVKPTATHSGSSSQDGRGGRVTSLKERRAMLDAKRWAQVLLDLKEKVKKADVTAVTYKDPITAVMILAAGFGNSALRTEYGISGVGRPRISRAEIEKLSKSKDQVKALAYLWESFKPMLENLLTYHGPITQTPKDLIAEAEWIAELIGVDARKMFDDVCSGKGFTIPKSWANLNADGTPKAAKTDKAPKEKAHGRKEKAGRSKAAEPEAAGSDGQDAGDLQ